jgi:hypothetical protein
MFPDRVFAEGSYRKLVLHRPLRKFLGEAFRLLIRIATLESSAVAQTVYADGEDVGG